MSTRANPNAHSCREPIAVVGTGLRLPGSSHNPSALWDLLVEPRDLRTPIPDDRFNAEEFYHPDPGHHGSTNVRSAYCLDQDISQFDANFFNIKPKEAHAIDPQQRLLLEVVYEAVEAAGMSMQALAGSRTGVYVGLMCSDYKDQLRRDPGSMPMYAATGTAQSIMSNRVSYFFDWRGPSMTIDTACSSSLTAVHQAVQLLRNEDGTDMAIAAGANLILEPLQFIEFSKLHLLSADPDSRCNMWNQDAAGYARGEGVAAIVLKRLSTAIADGDHIECIIRESGVNQDGRTKGITMPSPTAQADLIAQTYARAGLDPRRPEDRCQYFEAHGTGTQAGDPREAEAISSSFFSRGETAASPMYVGSIKTIVGHTEGTAGLAGLIKASLALQHGVIPPNYGFERLSTAVEPFYSNLKILTSARPWPTLVDGTPRRASVNSFGFGGSNAHVILEATTIPCQRKPTRRDGRESQQLTPFNFSAASEMSLRCLLANFASHLQNSPDLSLSDLSHTLYARRSDHAFRVSISAGSVAELASKLSAITENISSDVITHAKAVHESPRILGVFTGQGAQWAQMGKGLIMAIPRLQESIREMDAVLQSLPEPERPSWSLLEELFCDAETSRIHTATVGQPLCTMVQVLLCDLLTVAGIKFEAVVGHSGGEVAAGYAAGFIGREDALKIAYYRGLITDSNPPEFPGGMMAAGTSLDEARELCQRLEGRIQIAAINSSSSITLTGDLDAIQQAKAILDAEQKFARALKVDKAYHSWHMVPAGKMYVDALKAARINVRPWRNGSPVWYSSVFENRIMGVDEDLSAQYWTDNMVRPVLFSQALSSATNNTSFDLAIEIGPHPTLKSPALQTLGSEVPYTGLLYRGKADVEVFAKGLGYMWSHFSRSLIDFGRYDALGSGFEERSLMTGLPSYPWDHTTSYWSSSRASKDFLRSKGSPKSSLLGKRAFGVAAHGEWRWSNMLHVDELPWLRDHRIHGQIAFPASAYLSTAIEAAQHLMREGQKITLIEIRDLAITKPLTFKEDDDRGIETFFTIDNVVRDDDEGTCSASFRHYALSASGGEALILHASGRIVVQTGDSSSSLLPQRTKSPPNTVSVSKDQFYDSLEPLGHIYSGSFRGVTAIQRKLDFASTTIKVPRQEQHDAMMLHPGMLQSALQGLLLAFSHPSDRPFEGMHVLNGLQNLRVNVPLCRQELSSDGEVSTCSYLRSGGASTGSNQLYGDTEVYSPDGSGLVQLEGVQLVRTVEPAGANGHGLFAERHWGLASPSADLAMAGSCPTQEDHDYANAVERICLHYMRKTLAQFPPKVRGTLDLPWHLACLFDFFSHIVDNTRAGARQNVDPDWLRDNDEDVAPVIRKYADRVDVELARAVGDNLPAVIRGETTMLEHMTKGNLLDRFYVDGLGMQQYSQYLARTVKQLVHRYAGMDVLEIGAGTGGATKYIMQEVDKSSYSSYTYTDISTGFFETAQQVFSHSADRMIFKKLNVENDVASQGFEEHAYDLVVASLVLHATVDLNRTLANVRRLLRPGGYLIMTEVSNNDVSRIGFAMCAMPGWWLGQKDGRMLSPCIPTSQWHDLLLKNGFNGVDSATPDLPGMPFPLAVIVSQASDQSTEQLQLDRISPRLLMQAAGAGCDVVLVGGQTSRTTLIVEEAARILQEAGVNHSVFESLSSFDRRTGTTKASIALVLEGLDQDLQPCEGLSLESLRGWQKLRSTQDAVLHVFDRDRAYSTVLGLAGDDSRCKIQTLAVAGRAPLPPTKQLLQIVLGLYRGNQWTRDGSLYTHEPELAFEEGRMLVPRVYPSKRANDQVNATKGPVYQSVNTQDTALQLILGGSEPTYSLAVNDEPPQEVSAATDHISIDVSHSMVMSVSPPMHLVVGTSATSDWLTVALCKQTGSQLSVRKDKAGLVPRLATQDRPQFLAHLHCRMQIDRIMANCKEGSTLLLYEPGEDLVEGIAQDAMRRNIAVCSITSSVSPVRKQYGQWIVAHACSTKRQVLCWLPDKVSVFVSCKTPSTADKLGSLVASCLPNTTVRASLTQMGQTLLVRSEFLLDAYQQALNKTPRSAEIPFRVVGLEEAVGASIKDFDVPVIIDWKTCSTVSVPVHPVQSQVRLKSDKAYALLGFSTGIAQSLGDWMFARGARHIVITTRDGVDQEWLLHVQSLGLKVKVFEDVGARKHALMTLCKALEREWPPIAGVLYGGAHMQQPGEKYSGVPSEAQQQTLCDTAHGVQNLDGIFQHGDKELEFFVLFSPLDAVTGRTLDYGANSLMMTLVDQRRNKGLPGCVVHLANVAGFDNVDCSAQSDHSGNPPISERAFHTCVAEAIVASRPLSGRNTSIIAGLPIVLQGDDQAPAWSEDARFQHMLKREDQNTENTMTEALPAAVSIKTQLSTAQTSEDVTEIVSEALSLKLKGLLQLPSDYDRSRIVACTTEELGMDSLVAVEVRAWFLREIEADVPVSKILSGGRISQLVEDSVAVVSSHQVLAGLENPETNGSEGNIATPSSSGEDSDLACMSRSGAASETSGTSLSDEEPARKR